MAKKAKAERLDGKAERAKLVARGVPYYCSIGRDLHLGYRKGKKGGVWVGRRRAGNQYVVETIGSADDVHPANGKTVLNWQDAQDAVRRWAGGGGGAPLTEPAAPLTVQTAVEDYLLFLESHRKSAATSRSKARGNCSPRTSL